MKQANLIKTNEVVTIKSVSGGWTTIDNNGVEQKVRNSALSMPWEVTEATKAEEKHHNMNTTVCPRCGSEELYSGRGSNGIIIDEDKIIGCHACGWEYKAPGYADGLRRVRNSVYDPNNYTKTTSANGNTSLDCGDELAAKLRGASLDDVYKLAAKGLGVTVKELHTKYDHLNFGMQRMCLGNRLRSAAK
jgi:hypothetical protein